MNVPNISESDELGRRRASDELGRRRASPGTSIQTEAQSVQASAVSWGSILAGATAAASLALILTMLGTGLGLSAVSPWAYEGISAKAFGISGILWLTITQLIAAGVGGYLAGRLRTRWIVHSRRRGLLSRYRARFPGVGRLGVDDSRPALFDDWLDCKHRH